MKLRRLGYFIIDNWPALIAVALGITLGFMVGKAFYYAIILGE
jgi:hypothetical protein